MQSFRENGWTLSLFCNSCWIIVSNSRYEHFPALLAKMWEVYCLELIFCFIRLPQSQNYCYGI
jgi:hypothetical protein